MGLDQSINVYLNAEESSNNSATFRKFNCIHNSMLVVTFRKFNWLHNWMHQLHCNKYGKIDASKYNCTETELSREDLLKLQTDVITGNVQAVSGFFFGSQEIYEEDKENLLNVIAECLLYSSSNQKVTYHSWW